MLLELTDIHAGYNGRDILNGASLRIDEGEIIALIGPNGAGKSTILKVIAGFILPRSGMVVFGDTDVTVFETNKRFSKGIGYFLQGGEVFNNMTVFENFEMGATSLKKHLLTERIEDALLLFPLLKDKLYKRAGLLSGGERQMLALGMITLNRPKLLLLDEPSAGLAPGLVKGIMEKIVEINKNYGTAILLVEQKIKETLKVVQKCYLLKSGRVVLDGIPSAIEDALRIKANLYDIEVDK